jgi:hypothetical protein
MSSKTAGERIAEEHTMSEYLERPGRLAERRRSLATDINTAIRRAVAADRRKREKPAKKRRAAK